MEDYLLSNLNGVGKAKDMIKLSVYYQRGTELKNTLTKDHIIEGFESQLVETDDLYLDNNEKSYNF